MTTKNIIGIETKRRFKVVDTIDDLEKLANQETIITPTTPRIINPKTKKTKTNFSNILSGARLAESYIINQITFIKDNIQDALKETLDYIGEDGYIATLPEYILAKTKTDKEHPFWKQRYSVHTEENIGIDTQGSFYKKGEEIIFLINGGGIWTPNRIQKAHDEGLLDGSGIIKYTEWNDALNGKLADGKSLKNIYTYEEIYKGVSNLPHQFGVVMPYHMAQKTKSSYQTKKEFIENPLVIARNGGRENLENYFWSANDFSMTLGNLHNFKDIYVSTPPRGRLLCVSSHSEGLNNTKLDYLTGRFAGLKFKNDN